MPAFPYPRLHCWLDWPLRVCRSTQGAAGVRAQAALHVGDGAVSVDLAMMVGCAVTGPGLHRGTQCGLVVPGARPPHPAHPVCCRLSGCGFLCCRATEALLRWLCPRAAAPSGRAGRQAHGYEHYLVLCRLDWDPRPGRSTVIVSAHNLSVNRSALPVRPVSRPARLPAATPDRGGLIR
jgi:hypothetical protein